MSRKISRKLAAQADDLRRMGIKVYHYRRDVLPESQAAELEAALNQVGELRDSRETTEEELQPAVQRLEAALQRSGGTFYPKRHLSENVEMLLVAAILAIGVRTYFIQPYRIPTNSMYPTYNGMTHKLYETEAAEPSVPMQVVRAVTHGAMLIEEKAPVSGEIIVPLALNGNGFQIPGKLVNGRKWFGLLPEMQRRYSLLVGNTEVEFNVPSDFVFHKVVQDRFGRPQPEQLERTSNGRYLYHTGVHVAAGDPVLSFDILLGDQLFVDRFTCHFAKPKVGSPFVFRTDSVPGIARDERGKYYVKRLVGQEGDTLQVRFPVLYRNGEPIQGAEAFELNASQMGEYEGYRPTVGRANENQAPLVEPYTVPENCFFAMGDNSDESSDSRFWGPVPEKAVIGRPLFIYWPFAQNFGAAR